MLRVERFGDVTRLRMSSPGSRAVALDVSAYVLGGVMIDTGFHRARRELLAAVRSLGVHGAIVTHWHEDHAGNVGLLAANGIPVVLRAETERTLRARPPIQLYRHVVWGHAEALSTGVTPFDIGALECIHTPGHSADHQVVWDPATRTLFSGDLWLGVRARILHASENPYEIIESLRRIRALEPERMFDAHRGAVDHPARAIDAKIDWLMETMAEIERRIQAGWSDRAIVRRVLGGEEIAAFISRGDYARRNLVKAVRRHSLG